MRVPTSCRSMTSASRPGEHLRRRLARLAVERIDGHAPPRVLARAATRSCSPAGRTGSRAAGRRSRRRGRRPLGPLDDVTEAASIDAGLQTRPMVRPGSATGGRRARRSQQDYGHVRMIAAATLAAVRRSATWRPGVRLRSCCTAGAPHCCRAGNATSTLRPARRHRAHAMPGPRLCASAREDQARRRQEDLSRHRHLAGERRRHEQVARVGADHAMLCLHDRQRGRLRKLKQRIQAVDHLLLVLSLVQRRRRGGWR